MSDSHPIPDAPGIVQVTPDGRRLTQSGRDAQLAALARGRAKVAAAVSAWRGMGDETQLRTEIRQMALAGVKAAIPNMVRIARGGDKKAPKAAQVAATKLLSELGQVEIEARAHGTSFLSEMSLAELESSFRTLADSARDLQAIAGESQSVDSPDEEVPTSGTPAAPGEPEAAAE